MKWFPRALVLVLLAMLITIPPIISGYDNLASARLSSDDLETARYYESAARFLFWQPGLYEQAGLEALHADPQRAIGLLTTARQKGSLSPGGQVSLGDAYLALGMKDKALAEWEDLLAREQETAMASLRLAMEYHSQKRYSDEARVLNHWLAIEKNNASANERLGLLLAVSADSRALPLLETAAAASPESGARLAGLIAALKTPAADPAYRLALCGQALAGLDEWSLAEQAFNRAVNSSPQYAAAWAWLGLARQHNGSKEAQPALEYAVKLDARSAPNHAMLGTYWLQAGNPGKARAEFEIATQIEPANPAWWLALGNSQAYANLPAALNAYTQAVNLGPQDAANWYSLAAFCVEQNAYVEDYGLNAALRAYALQPKNPAFMDMLGRAQMAVAQWDSAEIMFKRALDLGLPNYDYAMVHYHLGLLYLQTSRNTLAKFEFNQTLKLNQQGPYGAQAKKLLDRYFP